MTIDRDFRNTLANALAGFLDGEIDNWALDDVCTSTRSKSDDRLCRELAFHAWLFYCDVRRYKNVGSEALPAAHTEILRRWERILHTDIEWSDVSPRKPDTLWERIREFLYWRRAPRPRWDENPYWPLPDAQSWNQLFALPTT